VLGNDLNMVVALAVLVPELGQISGAQAAALLGVMPYSDDSGQRHGKRQISGGREDACRALSMATLTATCRGSGVLASFYARLIAAGRPPKVALIACMCKLIVRLNAMFAHNQTWSDQPT
jgi:transposase